MIRFLCTKILLVFSMEIVDAIKEVVDSVNSEVLAKIQANDALITGKPSLIEGIWYEHGHILEIIETLKQKDASESTERQRYPVICLVQDFPTNEGAFGSDGVARLHVIIAMTTEPTLKAEERKERNFIPILRPIHDSFLKHLCWHPISMEYSVSKLKKTSIDRYYWGREGLYGVEGNIFDDWIDCIEIKDLQLKLSRQACK